jgi:hypothetical protein
VNAQNWLPICLGLLCLGAVLGFCSWGPQLFRLARIAAARGLWSVVRWQARRSPAAAAAAARALAAAVDAGRPPAS